MYHGQTFGETVSIRQFNEVNTRVVLIPTKKEVGDSILNKVIRLQYVFVCM